MQECGLSLSIAQPRPRPLSLTFCPAMYACCCAAEGDEKEIQFSTSALKTAIVVPEVEPKAPEFGVFKVNVASYDFVPLGVTFDTFGPRVITAISDGALAKFNEQNPNLRIEVYDALVAIDDVEDAKGMDEKLKGKLPETLTLKLNRPRQVKVAFKKTGGLGVKLDWKNKSLGIVVNEMQESGHIADWNKEHPSDAVTVRDRFVELDGKRLLGAEMIDALKKEKGDNTITLTALKY